MHLVIYNLKKPLKRNPENLWKTECGKNKTE